MNKNKIHELSEKVRVFSAPMGSDFTDRIKEVLEKHFTEVERDLACMLFYAQIGVPFVALALYASEKIHHPEDKSKTATGSTFVMNDILDCVERLRASEHA